MTRQLLLASLLLAASAGPARAERLLGVSASDNVLFKVDTADGERIEDLDGDGTVGIPDFLTPLAAWGRRPACSTES